MGVVWSATHVLTRRQVALKFLKNATEDQAKRLFREARIVGSLRHPNVVEVMDVFVTREGVPTLVMEKLDGVPLAELFKDAEPGARALGIMADVAQTLADVHAAGIVHRDLKPENVFVLPNDTIKILDFGLAKFDAAAVPTSMERLTQTGAMLGTIHYMAPEQVYGERDVDARADVWSLGVMLYELLTGERPFDGDNVGQVIKAITMSPIRLLEGMPNNIPRELAELTMAMLERDRDARRVSMDRVAASLRQCAATMEQPEADSGIGISQKRTSKRARQFANARLTAPAAAVLLLACGIIAAHQKWTHIPMVGSVAIAMPNTPLIIDDSSPPSDAHSSADANREESPKVADVRSTPARTTPNKVFVPVSVKKPVEMPSGSPTKTLGTLAGGVRETSPYAVP